MGRIEAQAESAASQSVPAQTHSRTTLAEACKAYLTPRSGKQQLHEVRACAARNDTKKALAERLSAAKERRDAKPRKRGPNPQARDSLQACASTAHSCFCAI